MDLIDEIRYEAKRAIENMQYEVKHTKLNSSYSSGNLGLAGTLAWGIAALVTLYIGAKYLGVM